MLAAEESATAMPHPPLFQPPKAVFFDRDGTLIEHIHYLHDPEGVVLLPGVREAVAGLRAVGVKLFLFTNQSGIGRGMFPLGAAEAVNRRLEELLDPAGGVFTATCIAPERPDEPSLYRKPSPRFILEMLAAQELVPEQAWMLGDSVVDWEAGRAAGVHTAAIVPDSVAAKEPLRREELDVVAYAGVLEWWNWVQGTKS